VVLENGFYSGYSSHFLWMQRIDNPPDTKGEIIHFNAGYAHRNLIDWRSCEPVPRSPSQDL
jgi:hypothetical protein